MAQCFNMLQGTQNINQNKNHEPAGHSRPNKNAIPSPFVKGE
jgi:hypothetical protein